MLKSTLRSLKAFVVATIVVVPAFAQSPTGPNQAELRVKERGPVGTRTLAYELYDYGQKTKDVLAVIAAASLMLKTPASKTTRELTATGSGIERKTGKAAPLFPPDLAAMLATARIIARKNETLLTMIDDLALADPKAPLAGPQWTNDVVLAGNTNTYTVTYKGGEPAEIAVIVGQAVPLQLRVIDENDREICLRDDRSSRSVVALYCSWRPKWTGPFHIKIENNGGEDIAFRVEAS